MRRTTVIVIGSVAAVLASSLGGLGLSRSATTSRAEAIPVVANGTVVATESPVTAARDASSRVGFSVVLPAHLPQGYRIDRIEVDLGPEGIANPLKKATVGVLNKPADGSPPTVIRIEETGIRFAEPANRATRLDLGSPSLAAYYQRTEKAAGYWLFTANRGFLITIMGPAEPAQPEMIALLKSLVQ